MSNDEHIFKNFTYEDCIDGVKAICEATKFSYVETHTSVRKDGHLHGIRVEVKIVNKDSQVYRKTGKDIADFDVQIKAVQTVRHWTWEDLAVKQCYAQVLKQMLNSVIGEKFVEFFVPDADSASELRLKLAVNQETPR